MPWVTRNHLLWGLLLPGRWYLVMAIVGFAGFFTTKLYIILIGALILTVGGIGFSIIWTQWRSFTLSIIPGERTMRERRGITMTSDRRINLGMIGSILYRQTPMGHLLDYGSLSITALGGPYEWENLGQFRTLRRIIESHGEWAPRPRSAIRVVLHEWLSRLWLSIHRLWERFLNWWRRQPRRSPVSSFTHNTYSAYERFMDFAEDFLFPRNTLLFEAVSDLSGRSGAEPTPLENRIFWRILKMRHVVCVDRQGRLCLHPRIRSMQDLQRCIPAEWFGRYFQQYQV